MSTDHESTSTDDDGTTTHTEEHVETSTSVTTESGWDASTPDGSGSNTGEDDDHSGDVASGG